MLSQNKMNFVVRLIVLVSVLLGLWSCKYFPTTTNKQKAVLRWHTVAYKQVQQNLSYAGRIQPVVIKTVIGPVNGYIHKRLVTDGQEVKKGNLLFSLRSEDLHERFLNHLVSYIRYKNELQNSKKKIQGLQSLLKAGVISLDQLSEKKQEWHSKEIDYLLAMTKLEEDISLLGFAEDDIKKLDFESIEKIKTLLHNARTVEVRAVKSGIVLPAGFGQNQQNKTSNYQVGDKVIQGESLLVIADPNAVVVQIDVNELDINRLQEGQLVTMTGDGFPGVKLQGVVASTRVMALQNQEVSGSVKFPIRVQFNAINQDIAGLIRMGMSAKIRLTLVQRKHLVLPVAAVKERFGLAYVQRKNKSGKSEDVPVVTGQAFGQDVAVLQGIKEGDQVLLYD
jgi:HlyD family secretion protein